MTKINTAYIIDDDPIFLFGTKKLMEIAKFCQEALVFKNGKEAISQLLPIAKSGKNLPQVILLDLNMPIMDGWQFLDEFSKIVSKEQLKLYIITSSVDPKDIGKAKEYSIVTDFISKPVTLDILNNISENI